MPMQPGQSMMPVNNANANACFSQCEQLCQFGVDVCTCNSIDPTQVQNSVCLPPKENVMQDSTGDATRLGTAIAAMALSLIFQM